MLPMLDLQRKSGEFRLAGRDWKLEGMEGHRSGDALGPEDLGIVSRSESRRCRKSGSFFFFSFDDLII
jgi:hypothetical protein